MPSLNLPLVRLALCCYQVNHHQHLSCSFYEKINLFLRLSLFISGLVADHGFELLVLLPLEYRDHRCMLVGLT